MTAHDWIGGALLALIIGAACNLDVSDIDDQINQAQAVNDARAQAIRERHFEVQAAKQCINSNWTTDEDGSVHCVRRNFRNKSKS